MSEPTYWLTTDNHLGHEKVFTFEPTRKGFETTIRYLKCVEEKDILINFGDIGFKDADIWMTAYVAAVKGKKILLMGNHDKKSYAYFYKKGFDFICERFSLDIYGFRIVFTHKPIWVPEGVLNIHGHFHTMKPLEAILEDYPFYDVTRYILITTENDCKPVNLKNVIDKHRKAWYNIDKKIKEVEN